MKTLDGEEAAWSPGLHPWVRRKATVGSRVLCMFCGADAAILSYHDKSVDYGRVELYCENGDCDAREVVVLVRKDGEEASKRADVRALDAVDKYAPLPESTDPPSDDPDGYSDQTQEEKDMDHNRWFARNQSDGDTRRRYSTAPFRMNVS